jgi:methionine aminopeptidase
MKHSESIINIAKALQEFNKEITNIPQTAKNPFYNSSYAPLSSIIETIRPIANKHGLSILQDLGDYNTISTMILHTSGEWICQEGMKMPLEKNTPQGAGSAITYGRRYSLSAMLNLATEEDDDGNSGENKPNTANKIKTEFSGTEITSDDVMKPGQQVIQEYWDMPKETRHTLMPKGYCAIKKEDGKWYVRPLSEKK